jgi:hypothetical protein
MTQPTITARMFLVLQAHQNIRFLDVVALEPNLFDEFAGLMIVPVLGPCPLIYAS